MIHDRCSPNKAYRVPASALINISHGQRKEEASNSPYKPTAVVKPLPGQEFISPSARASGHPTSNRHGQPQYAPPPRHHPHPAQRHPNSHPPLPPPPDFFPQWKSPQQPQQATASTSSYQQLKQQHTGPHLQQQFKSQPLNQTVITGPPPTQQLYVVSAKNVFWN